MVKLDSIRKLARKYLEKLYEGTCTITEFSNVYDPVTHCTKPVKNVICEGVTCHLSYTTAPAVKNTDTVAAMDQNITLFISPDILVKPGSMIEVTQVGRTTKFEASGAPVVYPTHQEIGLSLTDKEA